MQRLRSSSVRTSAQIARSARLMAAALTSRQCHARLNRVLEVGYRRIIAPLTLTDSGIEHPCYDLADDILRQLSIQAMRPERERDFAEAIALLASLRLALEDDPSSAAAPEVCAACA